MVVFDTNAMIWAVKRMASSGQEGMIARSIALVQKLEASKTEIGIPAPVLAEFLSPFAIGKRTEAYNLISDQFFVIPFDAKAAMIASEIRHEKDMLGGLVDEYALNRNVIKADILIMGTAIASGATEIFSHDKRHMPSLTLGRIKVSDIPVLPPPAEMQPELFGEF